LELIKIRYRLIVEYSQKVSIGRIYRIMSSMILSKMSTSKPVYKKSGYQGLDYENLLKQRFNPQKPNIAWVSDIAYVKVANRFCYVCVIIDLFSRRVIAYKTSFKINTKLVLDTFHYAYIKRERPSWSYVSFRQRMPIYFKRS